MAARTTGNLEVFETVALLDFLPCRRSADYATDLDRAVESLATAVHGILDAYCRSSNVSFAPAPIDRRPPLVGEPKEFVHLEDSFLFYVGSIHNLQPEWLNT